VRERQQLLGHHRRQVQRELHPDDLRAELAALGEALVQNPRRPHVRQEHLGSGCPHFQRGPA
jgi:hypothetical protein